MSFFRLTYPPGAAEGEALVFFRRFLALKIGAALVLGLWGQGSPIMASLSLCVVVAIGVACLRERFWPGLFCLFVAHAALVWQTWPFTLNHVLLEAVLLLLLLLDPGEPFALSRVSTPFMIKTLMLSVWFYSGLQKLIHGYYSSGELLALEALTGEDGLGENLGAVLRQAPSIQCCMDSPIHLPVWEKRLFQFMGLSTIATELFLPIGVFIERFRKAAIASLFALQLSIALLSSEIDFAFTAFAVLVLFVPGRARLAYGGLGIVYLLWLWGR